MNIFISFCIGFMTMFLILVAIGLVMFAISMIEQTKVCQFILDQHNLQCYIDHLDISGNCNICIRDDIYWSINDGPSLKVRDKI